MIDFLNFIVGALCAFILGLAAHSVYLHSKRRKELPSLPWDHLNVDDLEEEEK